MTNPVRTLRIGATLLAASLLVAGCGGSQPPADLDTMVDDTAVDDTPTVPVEVTPVVRDETPKYVDPNTEYASVLKAIHFEFNKYRITEESKPALEKIAALLKDHPRWKVLVEGHCDERGTNEYNLALGENRALSTKRYLVSLGVAESRFQTISYGEERPVAFGHDEASWKRNRRAEFRVEAPSS